MSPRLDRLLADLILLVIITSLLWIPILAALLGWPVV